MRDERERLRRLAEPHVVGEDAAEPVPPEEREPAEPGELVRAQRQRESGGLRQLLDAPVLETRDGRAPRDRGLGDIREILEVGPEARLAAVDAQAGLPLGERAGLLDELAQRREHRLVEREVALVDEQQRRWPLASARNSGMNGTSLPSTVSTTPRSNQSALLRLDRRDGEHRRTSVASR